MGKRVSMEKGFIHHLGDVGCLPAWVRGALYDGAPETMTGTLRFDKDTETEGAAERVERAYVALRTAVQGYGHGRLLSTLERALAAARAEPAAGGERVVEVRPRVGTEWPQWTLVDVTYEGDHTELGDFLPLMIERGLGIFPAREGRYTGGFRRLPDAPAPEVERVPEVEFTASDRHKAQCVSDLVFDQGIEVGVGKRYALRGPFPEQEPVLRPLLLPSGDLLCMACEIKHGSHLEACEWHGCEQYGKPWGEPVPPPEVEEGEDAT